MNFNGTDSFQFNFRFSLISVSVPVSVSVSFRAVFTQEVRNLEISLVVSDFHRRFTFTLCISFHVTDLLTLPSSLFF